MSSRSGHYFTWFVVFGLIAGVVSLISQRTLSGESIWLLASGIIGSILAHQSVNNVARYYDMIIGVIFAAAGLIGLVYTAKADLLPSTLRDSQLLVGSGQDAVLLGLSLAVIPATLHLILGYTSFRHGARNTAKGK